MRTVHRQVTLADMQVSAADGASQDLDQQFAGSRAGTGFSTYRSGPVSIGPGWVTTHARIVPMLPTVILYPYHAGRCQPIAVPVSGSKKCIRPVSTRNVTRCPGRAVMRGLTRAMPLCVSPASSPSSPWSSARSPL